jgi:predicted O-methyltransferase YrrM
LKVNENEVFDIPPAVRGIDLNETEQNDLLKKFGALYPEQPFTAEKTSGRRYFFENPNYSYADAIILYCMIRHLRPRRIVEIGSGYSSCAMLDVSELFFDNAIQCTFIDPYPQLLRKMIRDSDFARTRIIGQKVQDVDVGIFRELEASDILFIDSSHVVKTGSEVNYILFKILPLLAKGVYIHFHDIFYPFEYPQGWVFEGRAWNEAYLLRAFLQYNRAFKIRFFMTYLLQNHRSTFESHLPLCLRNTGANLWLEKAEQNPELERIHAPTGRKPRMVPTKVEPFHPEYLWLLGEGWYGGEGDHCWMEEKAVLRLAGPEVPGRKLTIRGYSPHVDGAQMSASADNIDLGTIKLEAAGLVEAEFSLPASLVGRASIEVRLAVDRAYFAPDDTRKLGLSIKAIEII